MIGMMSLALKFWTMLTGKKPTTTWLKLWTWPWIASVESPPSWRCTPWPGWKTNPRPSARTTASALLSSSQKTERGDRRERVAQQQPEDRAQTDRPQPRQPAEPEDRGDDPDEDQRADRRE